MTVKNLAQFPRRQPTEAPSQPEARRPGRGPLATTPVSVDSDALAVLFLRSLYVLLRAVRLYHQHHPRLIESLKTAGQALDAALSGSTMLNYLFVRRPIQAGHYWAGGTSAAGAT